MRHAAIIEALGGYQAVAVKIGRDPSTVFRWQETGIPPALWPEVLRLARRARVSPELTLGHLERGSPLLQKAS
jgi:hypothetical protein